MENDLGKVGGTQNRSDCYKHLSLSSLSSFWLCFRHKASFPPRCSAAVSGLTWVQGRNGTPWPQGEATGMELLAWREREVKDWCPPCLQWGFVSADQCWRSNHVLSCPPYKLPLNIALQSWFCGNLVMQLPHWITMFQVFPIIFF